MRRKYYIISILTVVLISLSTSLGANMARKLDPSDFPASLIGIEPINGIKVLREDLTMDFRKNTGLSFYIAQVTAIYEIECTDTVKSLPLVFVGGNVAKNGFIIRLNGEALQADSAAVINAAPQTWYPPDSVLWKDGFIPYYYFNKDINWRHNEYENYQHTDFISFSISYLPAGKHRIEVSYQAYLSQWYTNNEYSIYQSLVYILKPEPSGWESINNLHLTVIIPEECDYTCNLELEKKELKDGAVFLYGFWETLPERHVSVVIHKNDIVAVVASYTFPIISALLFIWLCLHIIKSAVKNKIKQNCTPQNPNTRFIRISNYITASIIITVEFIVILLLNESILLYCIPLLLVFALWIVRRYFPSKHKLRFLFRSLNCLAYELAALISIYAIISFSTDAILIIILMLIIFTCLRSTAHYSIKRLRNKNSAAYFGHILINAAIAIMATLVFFFVLFTNDSIVYSILNNYARPDLRGSSVYIILLVPVVLIIGFFASAIMHFIVFSILKNKPLTVS